MEKFAEEKNISLESMSLEELEDVWQKIK